MRFHAIMPVLKVSDFGISLRFYVDVLGFAVEWRSEDTAALGQGEMALMLSTAEHMGSASPVFTGVLYFDMTGVREFWSVIEGKAPVVWELTETDYGTLEFGIRDPDGYTLGFSEQLAPAA